MPDMRSGILFAALSSLLLLSSNALAAECEAVLVDALRYGIGDEARAVLAFDADRDGRPDIVAAGEEQTRLAVLHNRNGVFANDTSIDLGHTVLDLFARDVDGNGIADIIAAGPQHISTIFGDGFRVVTTAIEGPALAGRILLGNIAGDSALDVIGLTSQRHVRVFAGNAGGTFTPAGTTTTLPASSIRVLATGEVTGDAHGDVLIADNSGAYILPGNGDGTFGTRRDLAAEEMRWVGTARIDGDDRDDIVIAGFTSSERFTLLSSRAYADPVQHDLSFGSIADDFDGDGKVDFISAGAAMHRGGGDGTFAKVWDSALSPWDTDRADFDGDGRKDLVLGTFEVDGVAVLFNQGNGTFSGSRTYDSRTSGWHINIADLNRDGRPDVVASYGSVQTYLTAPDGTLVPKEYWFAVGEVSRVGDLTNDGIPDLYSTEIGIYEGKGDGGFIGHNDKYVGSRDNDARLADMNRDGTLDVVGVERQSRTVSVGINDGQRNLTFTDHPAIHRPYFLAVADVNGDGWPDALTVGSETDQQGTLRLLITRPDGTFAPSVIVAANVIPLGLAVADFDGDGAVDVVIGQDSEIAVESAVVILRGHGNGTFTEWQRLFPVVFEAALNLVPATGDFNGDGRTDIAVLTGFSARVYHQQPDRSFAAGPELFTDGRFGIASGDLNGDGADDLVIDPAEVHLTSCAATLPAVPPLVRLTAPVSSTTGTAVTFTATVEGAGTTGHVRFIDKMGKTVGVVPVVNGVATLTLPAPARGRHFMQAVYSGHLNLARSASNVVTHDVGDPGTTARRRAVRH